MSALWSKTFGLCPKADESLRDFYSALRKAAYSISGADSFPALGRAIYDFRGTLLDESTLSAGAGRTLERILDELRSLDGLGARLCASDLPASPFRILLLLLDSVTYNPSESANAISVYPYHVGMLVRLRHPLRPRRLAGVRKTGCLPTFSGLPDETAFPCRRKLGCSILPYSGRSTSSTRCNATPREVSPAIRSFIPYFPQAGATIRHIDTRDIPQSPDGLEALAWLQAGRNSFLRFSPKRKKKRRSRIFVLGSGGGGTDDAGNPAPDIGPLLPPPFFTAAGSPRPGEKSSRRRSSSETPLMLGRSAGKNHSVETQKLRPLPVQVAPVLRSRR